MRIQVGRVIPEIDEPLAGRAVGVSAEFGHGHRASEIGEAGFVGDGTESWNFGQRIAAKSIAAGLEDECRITTMDYRSDVAAATHVAQKVGDGRRCIGVEKLHLKIAKVALQAYEGPGKAGKRLTEYRNSNQRKDGPAKPAQRGHGIKMGQKDGRVKCLGEKQNIFAFDPTNCKIPEKLVPTMKTPLLLEHLEPRIAPAGMVIFTDIDGDQVTVKSSKGDDAQLSASLTKASIGVVGEQLQIVDLASNPVFAGTALSITAKPGATGGDGFVNVGFVNAGGMDITSLKVKGDLGKIAVGDGVAATKAFKSMDVQSMGMFGVSTGAPDLLSAVTGPSGSLKIQGDLSKVKLFASGDMSALSIGGSVIGGAGAEQGVISLSAGLGNLHIGGNIQGGAGAQSGFVTVGNVLGNVVVGGNLVGGGGISSGFLAMSAGSTETKISIKGSVLGGTGEQSAYLNSPLCASLSVGGDVLGGSGSNSGSLFCNGDLTKLSVGGSVSGGSGLSSGNIYVTGQLSSVKIGGDISGGAGNSSGLLQFFNDVGKCSVGGNVIGGSNTRSGSIDVAGGDLSSFSVGGNVIGGSGDQSAYISALNFGTVSIKGSLVGGSGENSGLLYAIGGDGIASVTVGGHIEGGAGGSSGGITTPGAKIGTLSLKGSIVGGDTAAGGNLSGFVYATLGLGSVQVGGSLIGGAQQGGGSIQAFNGEISEVMVKGSLIGGSKSDTGFIRALSTDHIFVGGDLVGGTVAAANSSGCVWLTDVAALNGTVKIGGSVIGSIANNAGWLRVEGSAKTVTVGGDVEGGTGNNSGKVEIIGSAPAMSGLSIGGSILGGSASTTGVVIIQTSIAKVLVGGSVIGGSGGSSGYLFNDGGIGKFAIRGSLVGGTNPATINDGMIFAEKFNSISIGRSVVGGAGTGGGMVFADAGVIGNLKIGGDLRGGSGQSSGNITAANGPIGTVTVGGSIVGGAGNDSGKIRSVVDIGPVSIKGDLRGSSGQRSGSVISDTADIISVKIGGSIAGGSAADTGSLRAGDSINSISIKGSVVGTSTANPVLMTASGNGNAIGSLTVGGQLKNALVLAGYNTATTPVGSNGASGIGSVFVGGNLVASSIVAGVTNAGFPTFGTAADIAIVNSLTSKIASIVVKGYAMGTVGGAERFGFVAEQIGSVTIGSSKQDIPAAGGFTPIGATFFVLAPDLNIHVVPAA